MAKTPLKIAQGFPGQIGLLAQQMANGFGGGLLAQTNYLNSIYDPVVMPQPFEFGDPKKDASKNDSKTGTKKPTSSGGVQEQYIMQNGQWVTNPNYRRIGSDR